MTLEEITGEEYEYIDPEEIKKIAPEMKQSDYSRHTIQTFIETYTPGFALTRDLKRELYKEAMKLNADAIIHYRETMKLGVSWFGFARGTPLRKRT